MVQNKSKTKLLEKAIDKAVGREKPARRTPARSAAKKDEHPEMKLTAKPAKKPEQKHEVKTGKKPGGKRTVKAGEKLFVDVAS